jgi:threonine/homoserine/homoserine lactone efflux protein
VGSIWEFLLVALVVTLTPGPATALVLRVAARDGRRAALGTVVGNSMGVLMWATLSAVGVSSLILASQVAYDVLRFGGAALLIVLGVRSLLRRDSDDAPAPLPRLTGWRIGVVTSAANPKLAVFFVALFPQFLSPGTSVLVPALLMGVVIVLYDIAWFSLLAWSVDRAGRALRPRIRRLMERTTGAVLIGLGVRVAAEAR